MVQKGKFCAGIASLVRRLKSVDLPTFGRPTMPIFRFEEGRPRGMRLGGSVFASALEDIFGCGVEKSCFEKSL